MPPGPRLSDEERALWARVAATVTPLEGKRETTPSPSHRHPGEGGVLRRTERALAARDPGLRRDDAKKSAPPADTLDGGWDRRLRQGTVSPERSIDLHGHTLLTAQ